jgi:hypothetical protein
MRIFIGKRCAMSARIETRQTDSLTEDWMRAFTPGATCACAPNSDTGWTVRYGPWPPPTLPACHACASGADKAKVVMRIEDDWRRTSKTASSAGTTCALKPRRRLPGRRHTCASRPAAW